MSSVAFYSAWNSAENPTLPLYFIGTISIPHMEDVMLTAVVLIFLQNSRKSTDILRLYDLKWNMCGLMESRPIDV